MNYKDRRGSFQVVFLDAALPACIVVGGWTARYLLFSGENIASVMSLLLLNPC